MFTQQLEGQKFDIRDHLERLTPGKEKNKYVCPVCEGHNLGVDSKTGKYKCWTGGCSKEDIREAIKPWSEVLAEHGGSKPYASNRRPATKTSKKQPKSAPIPAGSKLLRLPASQRGPEPQKPTYIPEGVPASAVLITYSYSDTQQVHRFQWPDLKNPKGHDKTYRQTHIDGKGKVKWSKGDAAWSAYRIHEVVEVLAGIPDGEPIAVLMVEGEPNVELARLYSIAALTLQGSNWNDSETAGMVEALRTTGKNIVLVKLRDNDAPGVKKGGQIQTTCDRAQFPCIVIDPVAIFPGIPDKGDIKEILDNMDSEEFIRRLEEEIHRQAAVEVEDWESDGAIEGEVKKSNPKPPTPRETAAEIAEEYRHQWKFDNEQKEWRVYTGKHWEKVEIGNFETLLLSVIDAKGVNYADDAYPTNVLKLLTKLLREKRWGGIDRRRFINFSNCVLDGDKNTTRPHQPGDRFTSYLPFEYKPLTGETSDPLKALELNCPNISRWMKMAMRGDAKKMFKLLAVINGCLRFSFHGWQMFVHLIGDPGSGKGTFTRLVEKVVGRENSRACSLDRLKDGSTMASIIDKQLVVFGDERKPVGVESILRLTGGDSINYREVYSKAADAYFYGLLLICSNDPIFMGNTTGLERRLCLISFDNPVPKALRDSAVEDSFDGEIASLIAIALSLPGSEVKRAIQGIGDAEIADFKAAEWDMKVRMDSVAAFFEMELIVEEGASVTVGKLYERYKDFCEEIKKPAMSLTSFSPSLEKICSELNQPVRRDPSGRHVTFWSLRRRRDEDEHPTYSQHLAALAGLSAGLSSTSAGLDAGLATLPSKDLQDLQDLTSNIFEKSEISQEQLNATQESSEIEEVTHSTTASPVQPLPSKAPSAAISPAISTESPASSPARQHQVNDASPESVLNEDEKELVGFVQKAIAENDPVFAKVIQDLLKEVCDKGNADREKVWSALGKEGQEAFTLLLKSEP